MRAPSRSSSSPYFLPQGAETSPTSPVNYGAPSTHSRFENAVMESGLFTTTELSEDEDISPACAREEHGVNERAKPDCRNLPNSSEDGMNDDTHSHYYDEYSSSIFSSLGMDSDNQAPPSDDCVQSCTLYANMDDITIESEEEEDEDEDEADIHGNSPYVYKTSSPTFRQKLWNYLFRNLDRAIDEIYCMCELESSIHQCQEATRALDAFRIDFLKLQSRIEMQAQAFKNRKVHPRSMAWEVKKGSNAEKPTVVKALEHFAANSVKTQGEDKSTKEDEKGAESNQLSEIFYSDLQEAIVGLHVEDPDSHLIQEDDENNPTLERSILSTDELILEQMVHQDQEDIAYAFHGSQPLKTDADANDTFASTMCRKNKKLQLAIDIKYTSKTHHQLKRSLGESLSPNQESRRTLHDKLSSPERRRRSPAETKRRQERRFFAAKQNRCKIDSERQSRLRIAAERLKDVNERNAQKLAEQEEAMWAKLYKADALHEAHLRWIVRKAGSENTKVDEVGFIKSLTTEHMKASLQQRLDESADRREQFLHQIRTRAREKAQNIRAAAKRRQQLHQSITAEKYAAMLKRHEEVEARQQERKERLKKKQSEMNQKERNVLERRRHLKKIKSKSKSKLYVRRKKHSTLPTFYRSMYQIHRRWVQAGSSTWSVSTSFSQSSRKSKWSSGAHSQCLLKAEAAEANTGLPEAHHEHDSDSSASSPRTSTCGRSKFHYKNAAKSYYESTMRQKANLLKHRLSLNSPGYVEPAHVKSLMASEDTLRKYKRLLVKIKHPMPARSGSRMSSTMAANALINADGVGQALRELTRLLQSGSETDLHTFRRIGGLHILLQWAKKSIAAMNTTMVAHALTAMNLTCLIPENKDYLVATNRLPVLIDLLIWALEFSVDKELIICVLDSVTLPIRQHMYVCYATITKDIIKYIVNAGSIVRIADRFDQFRQSLYTGTCPADAIILLKCIEFVEAVTAIAGFRSHPVSTMEDLHLPVVQLFKDTGLMGIISLLISLLMENRPARRSESPVLTPQMLGVSCMALRVLNNVACLDLTLFQSILSSMSIQHEFIHMLGYLLMSISVEFQRYADRSSSISSSSWPSFSSNAFSSLSNMPITPLTTSPSLHERTSFTSNSLISSRASASASASTSASYHVHFNSSLEDTLDELIVLIGYYVLENPSNQDTLRWGNTPNILQRLIALPFAYFSDTRLKNILFPTLIASSYGNASNLSIVETQVNSIMFITYLQQLLHEWSTSLSTAIGSSTLACRSDAAAVSPTAFAARMSISSNAIHPWTCCATRFPTALWKDAIAYFKQFQYTHE